MTRDAFRDAADPARRTKYDAAIQWHLETGFTVVETVDSIMAGEKVRTLGFERMLTIRVETLAGVTAKRPRGRPGWTAHEVQRHWDDALRHGNLPAGSTPEAVAQHFVQRDGQRRGVEVQTLRDLLGRFPEVRR